MDRGGGGERGLLAKDLPATVHYVLIVEKPTATTSWPFLKCLYPASDWAPFYHVTDTLSAPSADAFQC